MYVHKACRPSETELDFEKKAGGFCAACGTEGTVYHVKGQPDYYEHILNSILYKVQDGKSWTAMTAIWDREREQLAKVKAARRGENWTAKVPVEAESTEESEALAEVIEEAVEVEIEAAVPEEEEPEETELEAESKPLDGMAKSELLATIKEREIDAAADIARLEAELAELKK